MSSSAHVFSTPLGDCGVAWSERGICALQLPETSSKALLKKLRSKRRELVIAEPPAAVVALVRRVQAHLGGQTDREGFRDVDLDLRDQTAFSRRVYQAARATGPGRTTTYAELARCCRSPGAARAVGRAMAQNPVPIIVPCHRVVAADGLGGFSAHGANATKLRLLTVEGTDLAPLARLGVAAVGRADPRLRAIIRRAERFPLAEAARRRVDPFAALVESIIHQQVSMKAGAAIFRRLLQVTGTPPTPEAVLAASVDQLRGAGLSERKASYICDLARRVVGGELPLDKVQRLDDEAVIDILTRVKGIGRWSAEMFLMFHLGRLDVLAVDDLGLRKGAREVYRLRQLPDAKRLERLARPWIPYRSIGSWYLWRALDAGGLSA
jgi:O-6-methylguanine DNA methyltransferase